MHGQRIGYVRVSSFDQNPERQLEHVQVDRLFTDKASGKDTQRPELERLLAFAREGDTVVVHSMDRLARNLDDLRLIVQKLTKRGVRIEFVKENLTFTGEDSPLANLMLSVMGAFAIAGADGPTTPAGAGWRAEGPPGPRVWHQSGNPLSIPAHGRLTMPRRSLLTPAERASLLAFPTTDDELIRHYTFSEFDLASIRQRRGNHNRLGFAVQLVEAGIFERDARPGEHGVCIIKAEAVLGQIFLALGFIPFIHGCGLSYNYKCNYQACAWQEETPAQRKVSSQLLPARRAQEYSVARLQAPVEVAADCVC